MLPPLRALLICAVLASATSCGGDDDESSAREVFGKGASDGENAASVEEVGEIGTRELKDGLVVNTTNAGRGPAAGNGDRLRIHYEGRLKESGEVILSTRSTGIPFEFILGHKQVIPAWELGLRGVRRGEELQLDVPASLAYGGEGLGSVPPDSDLLFDVRVVNVEQL